MDHAQKAMELFNSGYNCAQSVFGAFCDVTGMELDDAVRLASSFGGGMGRLREVCGAVTGMFMAAGLLYGYSTPNNDTIKKAHYAQIQELAGKFRDIYGTYICRELLDLPQGPSDPTPSPRTPQYYADRPCGRFVYDAARVLDGYMATHERPVR